jgi:hypothetical protein
MAKSKVLPSEYVGQSGRRYHVARPDLGPGSYGRPLTDAENLAELRKVREAIAKARRSQAAQAGWRTRRNREAQLELVAS